MTWMICLFGGMGAMARYVLDVSIQRSWNRDGERTATSRYPRSSSTASPPCAPASP